ncbi:arabinose-proton symporter [Verticillium alfalfae VaMs.102]|uniref:Arabinose-proton symporter n=1 Tax=Verticillium alfalfae (strain VaMs.102 / ATCC MYA-4576 / FGSC 10136) TaxID=526221 RepID=C9SF91_VERA1|nr:arabinose-proton symporter [Verticillium alfalfae VaMs.102]EEY17877.1 arabinose-proton symporter [Verticillium alfalfae VaMs.102]
MPPPRADDEAPPTDLTNDHPRMEGTNTSRSSSNNEPMTDEKAMHQGGPGGPDRRRRSSVAALLQNPLAGLTQDQVLADVDNFTQSKGLTEYQEVFRKGALVAQVNNQDGAFERIEVLDEDEKNVLRRELTHRWSQPFMLYFLCTLCAGSAIVQGMDQSAVNGAQDFYFQELGLADMSAEIRGLVNGAPYLCSALIGCWTNPFLNHWFGRRGTIFISCGLSVITGFWQAAANNWYNLLIARFFLGFAVGAKSSTTPVYSAESTPKTIRGALTMMWQMWTAFGIALGTIVGVAFSGVTIFGEETQWRWIMASTSIPPLVVMVQVYLCPESPRWYMEKGRYPEAFKATCRLRYTKVQAARDMYYAYKLLEIESAEREGRSWKEFFTVRRNRRAAQSSWFVMFMQQFCGVNVIVYYSSASSPSSTYFYGYGANRRTVIMFQNADFTRNEALLVTMGTGLVNWLFAIPAIYTIDTFGRRNLLLVTFPLMSFFMFFTGFSFLITEQAARLACVTTGIYLFMAVYSPGAGPVPFTYSAEAFPLHIRDIGMCSATAVTWGFNFIISFSWLPMVEAYGDTGAFCWYGTWNLIGWVFAYFLLPETKNLTLEELDNVFNVTNREHAGYYLKKLPWYIKKHLLFQDVEPMPPLYAFDQSSPHDKKHDMAAAEASHSEGIVR